MGGRTRTTVGLGAALALAVAGAVTAAQPRDGEVFRGGYDPPLKSGQYTAKVRFRTADGGTRVRRAKFDFQQCGGLGGDVQGNPYHRIRFRAMTVDSDGRFHGKRVKYDDRGNPFTGTYRVRGRFTSATTAKGTVRGKIDYADPQFGECDLPKLKWTAKIE
jgi:hypothetical protein